MYIYLCIFHIICLMFNIAYILQRSLFGGIPLLNFNCPAFLEVPFDWNRVDSIALLGFTVFLFNRVSADFWKNWWENVRF